MDLCEKRSRCIFITGAVLAGLAVALGAFGAHGLKSMTDTNGLANWETAARYQFFHSLALLILALAWQRYTARGLAIVAGCFVLGTLIFSGTLYALVLTGMRWLGAITPIGGTLMIIGWVLIAVLHKRPTR